MPAFEKTYTPGAGIKRKASNLRAIDGSTMYSKAALAENYDVVVRGREAIAALAQLISQPTRNAHRQLQLFRRYSYDLIQYQFIYQDLIDACTTESERIAGNADRARKRWTPEEDSLLVDLATMEGQTALTIAVELGRTPGAVTTRLSYLVGIEKVSTEVAGRFVGWLDGEQVEGEIRGTVSKGKEA